MAEDRQETRGKRAAPLPGRRPTPAAILRRQLVRQQPTLAVINASVAVVFAVVAWHYAPPALIAAWLGCVFAVQALRLWLTTRDRLDEALADAADSGPGGRLTLASLIAGIAWGTLGWLFIAIDPQVLDLFVVFVIAGMAAGSITALPVHPPAFAAFLLPTLLPLIVALATGDRPDAAALALLTLGYGVGILLLGRHSYQTQLANAGLFLTNEALVASLREAGEVLESRVAARTAELEASTARLARANEQMSAEIGKRRRSEAQVRHLLHHDPLTDLPNRLVLGDRLSKALARARREQKLVAVVLFDIDRFKAINDTYGHFAADAVLRALAQRLRPQLRASDTVARMGGDEFAAIFADLQSEADVPVLADKLMALVQKPFRVEGRSIAVSLSLGIALYPLHGDDPASLLSGADLALYDAKQRGRARFSILSADLQHRSRRQRRLERELEGAVGRGELRVVFQPQVSVRHNHVTGAEALVRWTHPVHGLLPPAAFIPAAEASGVMREIDHWVIAEACARAAGWQGYGRPVRLAVNLSPLEFRQPGLAERLAGHLRRAELDPRLLEVEITESAYLDRETSSVDDQLHAIKALGARIAIDDFGTGYASLAYLRWLPVDVIKIDRSFVADITRSRHGEAIVASTVALATTLGKTVVAEGVETTDQRAALERLGCDQFQGYLFGRPASEDRLRARLAA